MMVCLKLITLACLLAVAFANPATDGGSASGDVSSSGSASVTGGSTGGSSGESTGGSTGSTGSGSTGTSVCNTCETSVFGGLGGLLANIIKNVGGDSGLFSSALTSLGVGITNLAGGAASIFVGIGKLGTPSTIDDIVNIVTNLGIAIGGVVNVILGEGVGELIATLLVAIFKVFFCVFLVGAPGVGISTHDCCAAKFGSVWGVKSYGPTYVDTKTVIEFYGILQIEAQILAAVKVVTNGGGVVALKGNAQFIIQWLLDIITVCKKSSFVIEDVMTVVVNIVTITGAIGNSCKVGLGAKLIADLLNKLSVVLDVTLLAGENLKKSISVAQNNITVCKEDTLYGAVSLSASASIKV